MRHLSRLSAACAIALSLVSAAPRAQSRPAATSAAPAPLPSSGASRIVSRTLANGLEILVIEDHAVPVVTIDLAVRNGSFTEPPELNGLSHLYEHMFFTRAMGGSAAPDPIDPKDTLGISFNGSTKEEVVEYFFTTTTPHFEALFGTAHGVDLSHAARLFGATYHLPASASELTDAITRAREGGLHLIEVKVRREDNPVVHRALAEKTRAALEQGGFR